MKSVAQDEVGSDVVGFQEGLEGACDLAWAVSKRQKFVGACQGPGAPPSIGREGAGKRYPRTQVTSVKGQARMSWEAVVWD